jgi:hypothetical protein
MCHSPRKAPIQGTGARRVLLVRSAIPVRVLAPKLPPTSKYAGPQAGPN